MRLCKPHPTKPNIYVDAEPEPWTVRYSWWLDNGQVIRETKTFGWESKDKYQAAGDILLAMRWDRYGIVADGVLYPPHRVEKVTWEVL